MSDRGNERLRQFHEECLRRLIAKLCASSAEIETFTDAQGDLPLSQLAIKNRPMKRLRYSLFENHLRKMIECLEAWHSVFDPSWFLLTLQRDDHIDFALEQHTNSGHSRPYSSVILSIRTAIRHSRTGAFGSQSIFRDASFVSFAKEPLPHSSLALSTLPADGAKVIIDTTTYPEDIDRSRTTTHVRDLARILSCSQPSTFGLLQCIGVLRMFDAAGNLSQYQFVFCNPPDPYIGLSSLRALLLRGHVSLNAKYRIATCVTRGVLAVHSADFVHKSIRPDTILVFSTLQDQDIKAYLVGFECTRPAAADTRLIGDMIWERNLYRHPSRQGIKPEEVYIMQHDIYSLGVCLLEIGLWNSLVVPSEPPKPGQLLHIEQQLNMNNPLKAAWEIKKILIQMAQSLLPALMGLTYTEVVLSCLTCLDPGATNMFANESDLYDVDGILVGVVFIEKILCKLGSLSV